MQHFNFLHLYTYLYTLSVKSHQTSLSFQKILNNVLPEKCIEVTKITFKRGQITNPSICNT